MTEIKDLDRETIIKAITEIKNNTEKRNGRESTTYDLIYEGGTYPPILVLSEANKLAGGEELTLSDLNNNTDKAFSKLKNLGFKIVSKNDETEDESILKNKLSSFTYENSKKFFEYVNEITEELNLREGDSRVVYSVRNDHERLAFTIGQRYCLVLQNTNEKTWGFITSSREVSSNTIDVSEFEGSAKAYWNKTDLFQDVENSLGKIKSACIVELERTKKSSYLKFNNSYFEKAVFDENYRNEIFIEAFGEATQNKPEPFINTLRKFLDQSKTENLKTSHYRKTYNDLEVKVSFGQGNTAKIPWISFLHETQTTSHGIYPVYLLFKEKNTLILAYGISETNTPDKDWNLNEPTSIKEYFVENDLGKPHRYGSSYIYKVYDLEKPIDDYPIDEDLLVLTNKYKKTIENEPIQHLSIPFNLKSLKGSLKESNLIYKNNLVERFSTGLATKPFLILTGLSGSGKTKLAQAFAEWICEDKDQINLVPVGADWTNREPLFGYPNALESEDYVLPESGVLQIILRAKHNQNRPYFLILDEMNLSHVERYFADFLSAIESNEEIKLHSGEKDELWNGVPPNIKIPQNLFIIGTVNIDETTYMFSPKVLDRANVIEFRVSRDELAQFLENPSDVDLEILRGKGAYMSEDFVQIAKSNANNYSQNEKLSEELLKFFSELNAVGAEFGYRSAYEINRFASLAEILAENWEFNDVMDAAVSQKLLPKLHGSRRKLEEVLFKLADLCHPDLEKGSKELFKNHKSIDKEKIDQAKYPISFEKIVRMHKGLVDNGFTSFAEA